MVKTTHFFGQVAHFLRAKVRFALKKRHSLAHRHRQRQDVGQTQAKKERVTRCRKFQKNDSSWKTQQK